MPPLTELQLLLAALSLPAEIAYGIGTVALLGGQLVVSFNVLRFLRRALLLPLLIGAAVLHALDLTSLLLINLAVIVVITVGIVWALARAGRVGWGMDAALLREQVSFGGRAFIGTIAERLHYRANTFLLTALVSIAATGVFSVALGLAETLWYLPTSFGLVLFSRAVRPGVESARIASAMTRTVLALVVVISIPLWLLAPPLVEIVYGAPFREAGVALQVMLPGVVAYSVVAVLTHFIIAWGAPGRIAAVAIIGLVINLAGCLALIPAFGMNGAAAASTISYTTTAVLTLLLFRRISGQGLIETLIINRSDIAARWRQVRAIPSRAERRLT
jgi:O-antigen/teichoic acid export membrane protein